LSLSPNDLVYLVVVGSECLLPGNKDKITKLTQQISGGVLGSQAFLGALQGATTQLWKKLSSEEQEKYRELAKEWSDDRPPKNIQAKYVTPLIGFFTKLIHMFRMATAAYRCRIVRDFQAQLYKTCGMHSVVLVAFPDESGTVRACM
jgi:hypothetical protein